MDELDKDIENNRGYTDEQKEDQKQSWKYGNQHFVLRFLYKKGTKCYHTFSSDYI